MADGSTPAWGEQHQLDALLGGHMGDPFGYLGVHPAPEGHVLRTFQPGAQRVDVLDRMTGETLATLEGVGMTGVFAGPVPEPARYGLRIHWPDGVQETEDPYSFGMLLGEVDLHLFAEGNHWSLADRLGAAEIEIDGVPGVRFAVWAPNARRVSVVGDFNAWDGRRHPMRLRYEAGVWELFVPRLKAGDRYKFEIMGPSGHVLPQKADPLARQTELPPATASVVAKPWSFQWTDQDWLTERSKRQTATSPIAIYEVHPGSWMRPDGDTQGTIDWAALTERLVPYTASMGFTHIELLPIMEHPFAGSWGYQPLSQFAPSARFGDPQGFAGFVDACHRAGIGVILDWVPAHFPTDAHGLGQFDGTALYEHADPREGFHQDWGTYIYNLGRREVAGFLIASALYWLETFHVDGLRVDAVSSMLYRDYSRKHGEWTPNIYGGRENLEAIAFLRRLNEIVAMRVPGAVVIAEESTAWPGVSAPAHEGGLGFAFKWNMGWMHDTLKYLGENPIYRRWHHGEMTFGLVYAFSERFVLPLSHDEVVHGKGSLYGRAPGDPWQKLANLRAYFTFMWTHPGKKLLFMGGELGQPAEWSHDGQVDWDRLHDSGHAGLQRLVADLNRLYAGESALHATDAEPRGFDWVVGDDNENSVYAYTRTDGAATLLVVLNMTPVPRHDYRIGVPKDGFWREIFNSDAAIYGGGNVGNAPGVEADDHGAHGRNLSIKTILPPLGALIFKHAG